MPSPLRARLASSTRSARVRPRTSLRWSAATSSATPASAHSTTSWPDLPLTSWANLLEVAEEPGEELQVAMGYRLFAAFRGKEEERGPANAVPLEADVDQAIGPENVEMAANSGLAHLQHLGDL